VSALKARCVDVLRTLGANPRLLPLSALLLRARTVRPASAFVRREGLKRRGLFTYRLRENGLLVRIRHGSGDVVTLGEVFHDHQYAPTAEVEQALGTPRRVLDLGANIGLFGLFAAGRWPQAQITAFEPDPANACLHERTIEANALRGRWWLTRAAAATAAGHAEFVSGGVALSHLAATGEHHGAAEESGHARIEVELRDVLPLLAETDLLKMDIEGGEWAILGDPRFRDAPPRAVVLEYHPRFCPTDDPAGAAQAALTEAGLRVQAIWSRDDGHGMLWAWRP
jgi:FkbM family methyltransferase